MAKQNTTIAIVVGVVIIVAAGVIALEAGGKKNNSSTTTPGASSAASSSDASKAVATTKVDISNYMFAPMIIKVKVGDTVTWTNQDDVHHNVVADTASADAPNGPLIGKGESYSFTFKKAGTYTFHCMPHPYMHGTVIVS